MRHHTTLLLAALALAPAPWNARAAESGRKEAPLKVSLVPGKMALVQDEPLCLNVTLTATRETGMVRPKFSGH
ncbi:MAG: hypothetical protein U9R68_10330, partial [Planctomycetota bacterium]|nr:hypothetical protein [Planctomycetota bacterium]